MAIIIALQNSQVVSHVSWFWKFDQRWYTCYENRLH